MSGRQSDPVGERLYRMKTELDFMAPRRYLFTGSSGTNDGFPCRFDWGLRPHSVSSPTDVGCGTLAYGRTPTETGLKTRMIEGVNGYPRSNTHHWTPSVFRTGLSEDVRFGVFNKYDAYEWRLPRRFSC